MSTGNVAVISVDTSGVPAIAWADGTAAIGQPVFALANPGGSGLRVGFGLVSGSGANVPRPARAPGHDEHRAQRAASARFLGRPSRRRGGTAARA